MNKPGNISSNQESIGELQLMGHEQWLIFATQASRRQRSSLLTIMKTLLVRFDSCIYVFYKDNEGKEYILSVRIL